MSTKSFFSNETVTNFITDQKNSPSINDFDDLSRRFGAYHKDSTNILLHLITTPIGVVGAFGFLMWTTKSTTPTLMLSTAYLLSLAPTLTLGVFIGTAAIVLGTLLLARKLRACLSDSFGLVVFFIAIVFAYLLQDFAHVICGEATFQSTYSRGGQIDLTDLSTWSEMFIEHCYYLVPLVVSVFLSNFVSPASNVYAFLTQPLPESFKIIHDYSLILAPVIVWAAGNYCIDSKNGFNVFPGFPYFKRVMLCSLIPNSNESKKKELQSIREWAMSKMPSRSTSSHWWFSELPPAQKEAFDDVARSSIINRAFRSLFSEKHYCMDVVEGMNEVYVTGPSRKDENFNSDQIFYTKHVDGPWGLVPFVSVFRCIVGMDRNYMTATHFPMINKSFNACEGDVLAFDFNREVHYITRDESRKSESDEFRVVLKLHYCLYPRILAPLGWLMLRLNVWYNQSFRALFLKTIDPKTYYEHFLAWNVVVNTSLFNNLESFVGQRNVLYLLVSCMLWFVTDNYYIFYTMTSFVHYIRYIGTFYFRSGTDFGSFKRDVLLFKTLALLQLGYFYLRPSVGVFAVDWVSLAMILSGYFVSVLATNALGVDRTYFGAELGICEPKWITAFPYGYIPHPMIVSQVWALLGFYKAAHFRESLPYAIPVHVILYLTHMMQEQFNIYEGKVEAQEGNGTDKLKKN